MIPANLSLVALNPARQAALQAIAEVEQRQEDNKRLPSENPHARVFMRLLTGNSRLNARSAQQIPGLAWDPSFKLWTLKMLEDELERLLRSRGSIAFRRCHPKSSMHCSRILCTAKPRAATATAN